MNFFNDEIHQEMIDMYKQFAEGGNDRHVQTVCRRCLCTYRC